LDVHPRERRVVVKVETFVVVVVVELIIIIGL
jgi:hypothetical protein